MRVSLVPRERRFYELFGRMGRLAEETLSELSASLLEEKTRHPRLRDLEHECDDVAHEIYNLVNRTFMPPMDAEDILLLARTLDTVVDLAEEVSDKIDLYKASPIPDSAKSLGECLASAGRELAAATTMLEEPRDLAPRLKEIHRLENEGDAVTRLALMKLFGMPVPDQQAEKELIKWKDLLGLLEATLDECESVAEVIEAIAIKNG